MSATWLTPITDDAGLATWHRVFASCAPVDFTALPTDPIDDYRPALTGPTNGSDVEFWLGLDAGVPVAAAILRFSIHDNLTIGNADVHVDPQHRRRGYGRRALQDCLEIVRHHGRERVLFEVPTRTLRHDPAPGELLLASMGGRPMLAEMRRVIDLEQLEPGRLDELEADAVKHAGGYSTELWTDTTPEPFLADMAELRSMMSTDPPQGQLEMEPEVWDIARYLENESALLRRGRQILVSAVRDDTSGQLVGYSNVGVRRERSDVGFQWDTIVRTAHRGHRLGMLLKVANLRNVRMQRPDVRYLNTWNADSNAHMVAVNQALGFQPMEGWSEWQIDL